MGILRTLFWVGYLFAYLIGCLPAYFKAKRLGKLGKIEEQQALVRRVVKNWAIDLLKKTGNTLEVTGAENLPLPEEPVVFVSNHQSYVDIPVVLAGLDFPRALLAKKQLGKIPMLSSWMDLLGCVWVDKDDIRASMGALRQCEKLLKRGQSIVIFPEGTRSKSDTMGSFKSGAVRVAVKSKVRIIPIAIDGSWHVLEGSNYRLKRSHIRMVILPAVETGGMDKAAQKQLDARLEDMIRTAKDDRTGALGPRKG